jgi:hypothetical protein
MKIDAFHLSLSNLAHTTWSYPREDAPPFEIRLATLTPALLEREIDVLLGAREEHLAERPVIEVVQAVGRVADRFLDPEDELRKDAIAGVSHVAGISAAMAGRVLDGMAADWRTEPLLQLLKAEFGDAGVLDEFTPDGRTGRKTRAFGPALTFHVFSGNVPGVSVTSLIRALLLKSASLAKSAAGEPVLAPLFARALAEEDAGLGSCLGVTYWAGGDEALEAVVLRRASAIIAYGSNESVSSLRARAPRGVPFLGYGHRVSLGVVGADALTESGATELARAAAVSVATFDQQGCVSPHLYYVEQGGAVAPEVWAELLASEMERLESELPRGPVAPGEAAAIRQARGEAEFGQLAGRGHRLFVPKVGTAWSVIFDPDPSFTPSCLNRLIRVKPIHSFDEVAGLVAPIGSLLQTVGVAAEAARVERLASQLGALGASRITPIGSIPWPPPEWHHDGRPPLTDLVQWCDLE